MMPKDSLTTQPHITLLMGVLNGAPYLDAQLDSLAAQTHAHWTLNSSDDGSADDSTAKILTFAAASRQNVDQSDGPCTGFSDNYMGLIRGLPTDPGHVAFADQDDIWACDKLARGIDTLRHSGEQPTLYCSRRWIWYPETQRQIASAERALPFDFKNALIENVASGNTIVLNPAAAELARLAAHRTGHVFAHDWWLYLLITGAGGQIIFDNGTPPIHYRQHAHNTIGEGRGIAQAAQRKLSVMRGTFANRVDGNIAAMNAVRDLLTPSAQITLDAFTDARRAGLLDRLSALYRIAPYRQTRLATLGFWGAAGVGRI
jgi:hypothetical protein